MRLPHSSFPNIPRRAPLHAPLTRVACIGDSITYGHGLRDESGDYSYPAVLARLLGPDWLVRNFGVSGTTLLQRGDNPYTRTEAYTAALVFRPDVVVIKLGTNDSKQPRENAPAAPDNWRHKADYPANYRALISAFRTTNPSVTIFTCLPVPAFPGDWGIDDTVLREEVAPLVRAVAADTGARVIDLYSALAKRPEVFPDGVHPDATGAALIADTVHRHVRASKRVPAS